MKLKDYCTLNEEVDLILLNGIVRKYYSPEKESFAMVVGASAADEGDVLKEFHEAQECSVKISAITYTPFREGTFEHKGYDCVHTGFPFGDGRLPATWLNSLSKLERYPNGFNLTYIRNPDLVDLNNWEGVFMNGLNYTSARGNLVTIIRNEEDDAKYLELCDILDKKYDIAPFYNDKIGSSPFEDENKIVQDQDLSLHYRLGIFKGLLR